ncbi:MAG: FixH family protein [Nitrospiraceae bacterium]|nr:FixH family protein [Nitrospiraceae bacterium]
MKKVVVFVAVVFLMTGIVYAKEFEVMQKAGNYYVEFKIDNLRVGANNVAIEIKDKSGKYVSDAKVAVTYKMPEGIDLPPMHFKADMKLEGNEYKGVIKIPMAGDWETEVDITRAGKTEGITFYLHTFGQ